MHARAFDAVIVGGGPAGATAAIRLAQAGWSIALVERQAFPRRKVCGECIAATNIPLLQALGIGEAFDAIAGPALREVALYVGDSTVQAPLPALDGSQPWGRALGREHLDTLLVQRAAAAGATLLQPCSVKRVVRDAGVHTCHVVDADGAELLLQTRVLIAAHGSWEPDPFAAGPHRPKQASDLFAFKANYLGARIAPGVLPVLAFRGGYGGIVLGDHGRTTLAFCIRRDALQAARGQYPSRKAAHAALAHVVAECRGVRDALEGAELEAPWLGVGPIRPGIRSAWRGDGTFAVGNVAGEAHPILGEGMSMAIQSAWLLADRLIVQGGVLQRASEASPAERDAALAAAGRAYAATWHRNFAGRIRLAAVLAHLAIRPGMSRPLLPILRRWPGLLTSGARAGGKVRAPEAEVVAAAKRDATAPSP